MREKVLIVGITGMMGHALFTELSRQEELEVWATARTSDPGFSRWLSPALNERIRTNIDADNFDSILRVLADIKPSVVVNCIGIIKQLPVEKDQLISISINSLFPHRLALACKAVNARMIQISTEWVFSGEKENYKETDVS